MNSNDKNSLPIIVDIEKKAGGTPAIWKYIVEYTFLNDDDKKHEIDLIQEYLSNLTEKDIYPHLVSSLKCKEKSFLLKKIKYNFSGKTGNYIMYLNGEIISGKSFKNHFEFEVRVSQEVYKNITKTFKINVLEKDIDNN